MTKTVLSRSIPLILILCLCSGCWLFERPETKGDAPNNEPPPKAPIELIGDQFKETGEDVGGPLGMILTGIGTALVIGGGIYAKSKMGNHEDPDHPSASA